MAQRPARTLPAAPPPLSLDALLARAGAVPQPHTQPRPKAGTTTEAAATASPPDTPRSLLLTVTVSHCACGASTRHAAPYVLVRYAENSHSFHYRRTDLDTVSPSIIATLPRERRETHVDVPFCEECF